MGVGIARAFKLTNEVKRHACSSLIRPSIMVSEGIGVPVGHPQPRVEHASICIVSGSCSGQGRGKEEGSGQKKVQAAPQTAQHLEINMNDAVEGGGRGKGARSGLADTEQSPSSWRGHHTLAQVPSLGRDAIRLSYSISSCSSRNRRVVVSRKSPCSAVVGRCWRISEKASGRLVLAILTSYESIHEQQYAIVETD